MVVVRFACVIERNVSGVVVIRWVIVKVRGLEVRASVNFWPGVIDTWVSVSRIINSKVLISECCQFTIVFVDPLKLASLEWLDEQIIVLK